MVAGIAVSATALGAAPASAADVELNKDFTYTCNVVAAGLALGDFSVGVNARVVIPEVVAPGDTIPARKTQITLTLPEPLRSATYGLLGARSASGFSNDASINITVPGITDPFVYPIANLAAPWSPVPATSTPPWQIPTEGDVPAIPVPTTAEYPGLELPSTGTIHMPRAFNVIASLRNAAGELVGGEGAVTMACTLPAASDDTFGTFGIAEVPPPPNTPPTAGNVTASTDFGAPVDITLAGADADEGDELTYTYGTPANGTVTGEGADVTYTPDEGFFGTDTFTYTVSDGEAEATGTVTVNVGEPPNQAPTANDGTAAVQSGDPVDITLSASDPDGDDLTYTYTQPENGTVSGEGPNVTYTSDEGFAGDDTFTFTVDDGNGGTDTATITVSVTADPPTNVPPTAGNVTAETREDEAVDITLEGADADEGDTLTYTYGTPANGTVTGEGADVTYTPNEGFFGTDTFTYTVDDGNGGTATGTVTVTVTEVIDPPYNTPPTAGDVTAETNQDEAVDITLEGADADEGDTLTYTYGTPANGTVTGTGADVTYTPNAGFFGTDTFTYTVSDGEEEATGTVTVTVNEVVIPPNTPPTAGNVTATTNQDRAVNIALRGADADGDTLTYTYGTPANGTVTGTGANVTYTPRAGFSGTDTFTYTVSDGQAEATGTVTVTVTKVTQPPADKCGPMPNPLREPIKWLKWLACKILGHLGR
ncbi:tandem-95 repeat protein [Mumia sp. zg.B17]|uniref:Ig-like domain-containing protein n=1 Tax=Mumia sp. zg.B17 TaxID=2855446 RepID=UPI001C6F0565|nr:Ig-like domain-containing protein [Mumia sp. zg.B17]MBW9204739.1 tandem-95 repeat protein [Mumia sp. zg.B17]